jgi:hypothetical protein
MPKAKDLGFSSKRVYVCPAFTASSSSLVLVVDASRPNESVRTSLVPSPARQGLVDTHLTTSNYWKRLKKREQRARGGGGQSRGMGEDEGQGEGTGEDECEGDVEEELRYRF